MSKKILIVDDNESILMMVSMILRRRGYTVFKAKDGNEGISIAKEETPDLIILDVGLPDMNGHEVCKVLRGDEKTGNIKIVLLTGKAIPEDMEEKFKGNADSYLLKPFDGERLLSKVVELLG